jgi:hypothetical protein
MENFILNTRRGSEKGKVKEDIEFYSFCATPGVGKSDVVIM